MKADQYMTIVRTISENKENKKLKLAIGVSNIELLLFMLFFPLLIAYEAALLALGGRITDITEEFRVRFKSQSFVTPATQLGINNNILCFAVANEIRHICR